MEAEHVVQPLEGGDPSPDGVRRRVEEQVAGVGGEELEVGLAEVDGLASGDRTTPDVAAVRVQCEDIWRASTESDRCVLPVVATKSDSTTPQSPWF